MTNEVQPLPAPQGAMAAMPFAYANQFTVILSNTDINVIFMLNGQPAIAIGLSYHSAKSLSNSILESLGKVELATKRPVLSVEELQKKLAPITEVKTAKRRSSK